MTSTMPAAGLPSRRRTNTDLLLFLAATFAVSRLPWGAALLAGGDTAEPLPRLLYVVGTFGPTAVALLLWCCGRRRPRGPGPFRGVVRWLPPALVLGSVPPVAGALVDGTLDLAIA